MFIAPEVEWTWVMVQSPVFAYYNIQNFTWCPKSAYHIADSCICRGTLDTFTVWCTFSNLFALYKTVKNVVLEIILILHPFLTTAYPFLHMHRHTYKYHHPLAACLEMCISDKPSSDRNLQGLHLSVPLFYLSRPVWL